MTDPHADRPTADRTEPVSIADTAMQEPEESVRQERESVGDRPDTGGLVPPDDAQ